MCDADGNAYSTDGGHGDTNLSYRDFYIRGMACKCTVTEILYDAMSDEHKPLNIISAPMYGDGENIEGVIGLTYYSTEFNAELQIKSFGGKGKSYAINEEGQVIVAPSTDGKDLAKNLFSDILAADARNADRTAALKSTLAEGKGGGRIFLNDDECNYYCRSIQMLDGDVKWTIITTVSTDYMQERISSIDLALVFMLVIFVAVVTASVAALLLLTRKQRRTTRRLAYVDSLTGGDNFVMFEKRLTERRATTGTYIAIDIADFKSINVAVGVDAGNAVLKEIYETLKSRLSADEYIAHVGHDEFILFVTDANADVLRKRIAEMHDMLSALAEKLDSPAINAKFGVCRAKGESDVNNCFTCARQAVESIKDDNNDYCSFYYSDDNQKHLYGRELLTDFDSAVANSEFEIGFNRNSRPKRNNPSARKRS